jgi:transposase
VQHLTFPVRCCPYVLSRTQRRRACDHTARSHPRLQPAQDRPLGLVPRQYSTGGKANLLGISKRGDKHLRQLLVQCSRVYMQRLDHQKGALADWVRTLLSRRHSNVVACARANKLARIAWAIAARHTQYEAVPDALNA